MKTSRNGCLAILHHEAVVLTPYKDSVGVWTIGAGITESAVGHEKWRELMHSHLTIDNAIALFSQTLSKYEAGVNAAFTRPLEQHQFDAAVSFHWNTGAIKRASWVKMFNAGRSDEEVASAMMRWAKPKALFQRRRAEKRLFLYGEYPPLDVHTYTADANGHINWHSGKVVSI